MNKGDLQGMRGTVISIEEGGMVTFKPIGFGSLTRSRSSVGNALFNSTLNSTLNSLDSSSSVRTLRLEAAANRPRARAQVEQPTQRPLTPAVKEPWMVAPGIGFGQKFYYRP